MSEKTSGKTESRMDFVQGKLSQFSNTDSLPAKSRVEVQVHLNPKSVSFLSGYCQVSSPRYLLPKVPCHTGQESPVLISCQQFRH